MAPPTSSGLRQTHTDTGELISGRDGARSSKLKKLELLAAKRYLNPPKFSYGRDHQQTNHQHHHKSSKAAPKIISPVKVPTDDLIQTSPKRSNVHFIRQSKHSIDGEQTLVIGQIDIRNEPLKGINDADKMGSNNNDKYNSEAEVKVLPALDKVDETQELEDMGSMIEDELDDEGDKTLNNWKENKELMNEDFPSLKIASRISPGDKFYKSLQHEKTKYGRVAKNLKEKEVLTTVEAIDRVVGPESKGQNEEKENAVETVDDSSNKKTLKSKTTPKSTNLLNSLNSTLNDVDKIEELINTPTRSSRKRTRHTEVTSKKSPEVELNKSKVPETDEKESERKHISQTESIASSLAQEMKSMRGIRDTSPTPLKRKKQEAKDDLFSKVKTLKLLHTDEARELFGDSQDPDNFVLSSQETVFDTPRSSPVKHNGGAQDLNEVAVDETQTEKLIDETSDTNISASAEDVEELKTVVLKRLVGQLPPLELYGLDDHYHQLYRMLKNTVTNQEGNSCLIMGPSGTGKKTTVNKVILDLNKKYWKQFITVRLSGAVQTDEKLAIRSIAQQIDSAISTYQESEQQELKISDQRNSNRTLRALLKVLDQNDLNDYGTNSIDRNLSVAIVFVIDEFHKFTEYNRQSLLYNLFDLSQNSNTPISVVGLTTKITTREMLEKRVKSRFSQKLILFNKPLVVENFIEQFLQNCLVDEKEVSSTAYADAYNKYLIKQAKTISSPLHKHLLLNYYTIKSVKESLSALVIPISRITSENPFPKFSSLIKIEDPYSTEIIRKIRALSDLELSLLLACCRIVFKSELNVVDFNSCYNEYHSAMLFLKLERISSMTNFDSATGVVLDLKIWPKLNTKKAWELLQNLGLIVDDNANYNAKKISQNQAFNAFSVVITLEELRKSIDKQSPLYLLTAI